MSIPPANEPEMAMPMHTTAIAIMTWGFRAGAALLAVGLALAAFTDDVIERQVDEFGKVIPALLDGESSGFIDMGILTIMATPLATVFAIAIRFEQAGDRRYALLSLVVLAILAVSVALALAR